VNQAEVRARADELRSRRVPFVEATVVRAERPTSAKPGDGALVLADGSIEGFVGGECAEASVTVQALNALDAAQPVLLRISPDEPTAADPSGTITVHNPCLSGGTLEIFLEPALPAPLIVVHGEAPIARAVVALAERLGYALGPGPPASLAPDTIAVVVASHGRDEAAVLTEAARRGVPYIGLVASARRGAAVLDALELSEDDRRRIRTPAGLDIGARTPAEVALAILAEIVSCRPRPPAPAPARAPTPAGEPVAGTLVDPVCGMTVHGEARHVDYEGVRYGFCGSGCQQAFLADPSGFLSR